MYRIKRANGAFFASIASNVILGPNNPGAERTPINLIGRNKVSYGQAQNENFLWLTENFASGTDPAGAIKGQLWYDTTNDDGTGSGGELKIAPADNSVGDQWLTVPVIAEVTNEPSESAPGRLIIYKKKQLKVRMDNSWHSIVTEVAKNEQLNTLLPINYNSTPVNGINTMFSHQGDASSILTRFNEGGYLTPEGDLGGTNEGTLRYNSSYAWEADILARDAINSAVCKFWKVRGMFFIDTQAEQGGNADPRRIHAFDQGTIIYEVVDQTPGAEDWDVVVEADQTVPPSGLDAKAILNGDYYGLVFKGNVNKPGAQSANLRWSIMFKMIGANEAPTA